MSIRYDRLRKVIRAVEAARPEKFDMSTWRLSGPRTAVCNTVACAVGHYAIRNPKSGMKILKDGILVFGELKNWAAVQSHFGLGARETDRLFCASFYSDPSRENVLARLREFVARERTVTT